MFQMQIKLKTVVNNKKINSDDIVKLEYFCLFNLY